MPVANAYVMYGQHTLKTNKDGVVKFSIDQNKLKKIPAQIKSLDQATVSGEPIVGETKKKLLSIRKEIEVGNPVKVTNLVELSQKPEKIKILRKLVLENNSRLPVFSNTQYAIYGVVKDYQGHPIKDARVQITREGGEGFAFSQSSDENGNYFLYYIPDDDDELNLAVKVGKTVYHLPKDKVYFFPEGTSVETNIQLPKEGNTIVDKPPYLVSKAAPGANYSGVLVGPNIDKGVSYKVTIPKNDVSFSMIVPKKVWNGHPNFFETIGQKFLKKKVMPGIMVNASFIPKPNASEPDYIEILKMSK